MRDGQDQAEGWRLRKDGSRFWASVVLDCIRDEDGALLGFAKVTRDATDRREAQRILDQAQEQLFHAQKTEAIGQLTGGVAHEFNNLLTVTLGNLEMARRFLQDSAPGNAFLHIARAEQSSLRAATLTDRLLEFSRQQTLQPRPIDCNELVAGMSGIVRPAVGENIAVETVLAGGLWRINVDPNRLESALLNLVINARDAMTTGGKLTIETANVHLDPLYAARHDEVIEGRYVLIAVTDFGTGMASDVAARAFEPFYTTKGIGQGTGLGLSQVFGFVKQSGGHVKIYSEVGHGTSVKIYLPCFVDEGLPQYERSASHVALPRALHEETILIVEDEADVRAYSCDVMTQLGYPRGRGRGRAFGAGCAGGKPRGDAAVHRRGPARYERPGSGDGSVAPPPRPSCALHDRLCAEVGVSQRNARRQGAIAHQAVHHGKSGGKGS